MLLQDLEVNFLSRTDEDALTFITEYRERRKQTITSAKIKAPKKKAARKKAATVTVTAEQLQLLKALGLV